MHVPRFACTDDHMYTYARMTSHTRSAINPHVSINPHAPAADGVVGDERDRGRAAQGSGTRRAG